MNTNFIHTLTEIVATNLSNENFGPEDLANKMGMSHSTLHRKLKDATGQTISQFICEVRLKKAEKLLLTEDTTISEIAYNVGFGSPTYFSKCFHDYLGVAPGEFRKKEIKSEPEEETEPSKPKRKIKNTLLLAVSPFLILISVFLFLNEKYSFLKKETPIEKSIAVLPVNYLGDPEYQHQAEGTMEEIKNNLAKIEDLLVLDRNSVEQYRSTNKSEKEIGKELKVGAVLKITFQKEDENIILFVNLINANDGTILFSEKYPGTGEGIFSLQSKIAETIANELKAKITPDEKQLIEKIPTDSLTAYDFYLKGNEEFGKYGTNNNGREVLERAEIHFKQAIKIDSVFAEAYVGLAKVYWHKHFSNTFFSESFLDSVLILSNKALSLDNKLADAYVIRGDYYRMKARNDLALADFSKALKYNPNKWGTYFTIAQLYYQEDFILAIQNFQKAAALNRGKDLPALLAWTSNAYLMAGFPEKFMFYRNEKLKLDFDTSINYMSRAVVESYNGNIENAIELALKGKAYENSHIEFLNFLGKLHNETGQHEEALNYHKELNEIIKKRGLNNISGMHRIGYTYWMNGYKEIADSCFDKQIAMCNQMIELKRDWAERLFTYYDLAGIYAFRGDKEKAYENLRIFNQRKTMPFWMFDLIKKDPLFNNIRNEPEFKHIKIDIETKYRSEHERAKKWLEEQKLL